MIGLGDFVIAKKPKNHWALTEGRKYKISKTKLIKVDYSNDLLDQLEFFVRDDISDAWYPSEAFMTLEESRSEKLKQLGI